MARKIRIEYCGATYHVMARGNQGRDIRSQRPAWLVTERVLGELALGPEDRVGVGLPLVGLGETDLAKGRKGTPQKDALAWWLCRHTAVRRAWVSQRLRMGDESRVTQAIRRVQDRPGPELAEFKRRLEGAYLGQQGHSADVRS
jgi:hypothetical protein